MKLKQGDTVMVLKGSHKGETGVIMRIREDDCRVIVKGVNVRTIHKKPRVRGEKGEIIKREMPIAFSNVALVDPKTKKPTRVGFQGNGRKKVRVARKSGTTVSAPSKKK